MITEFRGENRIYSNFFIRNQYLHTPTGLLTFRSNEHFFVFCKTLSIEQKLEILNASTPTIVKRMGSPKGYFMPDGSLFQIELRPDWNTPDKDGVTVKEAAMMAGLELKYGQNPDLKQSLINTYPKVLQEGNYWNDKYWGVCLRTGEGLNKLGKIHMDLRTKYILERG